jgi:Ca-activated chloride channel family protein
MFVVAVVLALSASASADPENADKTLSPYFVVEGSKPGVEAMPLESTRADVHITGVIADVVVTQTYRNDGDQTINARYVFPASTRAAVYGMKMTIGSRTIEAKIKEREAARAEYEEAKRDGKTASLLEEDRPNVFSMNVANILPKDKIDVELHYTELLVPTDGTYELDYPQVVGPRYVSEAAPHGSHDTFTASPYTHAGTGPGYTFGVHVAIAGGMELHDVSSPSHTIHTAFAADHKSATVDLDSATPDAGQKDFVLRYQLAGGDISQGLLTFQGAKENFFLMMVQPPRRPALEQIVPRDYVFIVDVSGSMSGFPLDTTKKLMRELLSRMRPTDTFDVELFSGATAMYAPASVPATKKDIDSAIAWMDSAGAGGGTELLPAIQTAMTLPKPEGTSRSFVVVTDGYIAEEPAVFDQIRDHLGEANVFSFGIGSSVNRHLMEGIAKAGQGEPFIVLDEKTGEEAAAKFRAYVEQPVLTHVAVKMDGFDAYDVEPEVIPDVFAQRPVIVFGKYKGAPTGTITLTGESGRGRFVSKLDVASSAPDAGNGALAYLWARSKISELSDFYNEDKNHDAVVALGLRYNLLTKFTSFIAVEQVVRTTAGSTDVAQPLPMPAGVSDMAVGGNEQGAEPGLLIVLGLIGGLLLGWHILAKKVAAS